MTTPTVPLAVRRTPAAWFGALLLVAGAYWGYLYQRVPAVEHELLDVRVALHPLGQWACDLLRDSRVYAPGLVLVHAALLGLLWKKRRAPAGPWRALLVLWVAGYALALGLVVLCTEYFLRFNPDVLRW